jgi:hypothetical protein
MKFNARWLLSLILTAVLACGFTYAAVQTSSYVHRDAQLHTNVFVIHEGINGKEMIPVGNVITDIGENTLRDFLGFGNATIGTNQTKYIALGNASVAQTLTVLTTECVNGSTGAFGRALSTVSAWQNGTDYAFNVTHTFTQNVTETINAAALHWFGTASADNCMFACAAITQTAFASGDNCTITWVITLDAN